MRAFVVIEFGIVVQINFSGPIQNCQTAIAPANLQLGTIHIGLGKSIGIKLGSIGITGDMLHNQFGRFLMGGMQTRAKTG